MKKQIFLTPRPLQTGPIGNEHVLGVKGFEDEESEFIDWEIRKKLKKIFPDASDRGNRFELEREPTKEELVALDELANELGAEPMLEVRTDAELEIQKSEIFKGRKL